jgi:hypothetical protein
VITVSIVEPGLTAKLEGDLEELADLLGYADDGSGSYVEGFKPNRYAALRTEVLALVPGSPEWNAQVTANQKAGGHGA